MEYINEETGMYFDTFSDLYCAGRRDDGTEYHAEVYYVRATDKNGNRWHHEARFPGCIVTECDDEDGAFQCFNDVRAEATAQAEKLLARIAAAGGKINLAHWHEARPEYGSKAYQAYGMHEDWMEEQMERHGMM